MRFETEILCCPFPSGARRWGGGFLHATILPNLRLPYG